MERSSNFTISIGNIGCHKTSSLIFRLGLDSNAFAFFDCVLCIVHEIMEKFNYKFKTESHNTIYTFKDYFITMFLVFNNKQYSNRSLEIVFTIISESKDEFYLLRNL